jgi:hypothetical protein
MPSHKQRKLDKLMAEGMGQLMAPSGSSYIDDMGIGEIAFDAYKGGDLNPSGEAPYMDDLALGQATTDAMNAQGDANRMLLWGGLAIAAFIFLGGRK